MSRRPKKRLTDLAPVELPPPPRPSAVTVRVSSKTVREGQQARANPVRTIKRFAERAHEKLHGPLVEWIHYPISVGKRPLIEAYQSLSTEEKEALDEQVREAFEEHHGAQVVHVYRRRKTEEEVLSGLSMTTSFDEVSYLDPKTIDTYLVPASAVMLHWGMSVLGDKSFEHEQEIILKPGVSSQVQKVEFHENPTVEPADRIVNIVKRLQGKFPGGRVPIYEIRKVMPDVQGIDFDKALAQLALKKKIHRTGESLSEAPLSFATEEEILAPEPDQVPVVETKTAIAKPKPKRPRVQKPVEILDEDEVESPALEEVPPRHVPPPVEASPPFRAPPRALLPPVPTPAPEAAPRTSETPASAYLESLSLITRRSALTALTILARELGGDVDTYSWGNLRKADTLALQNRIARKYDAAYANRILATLRGVLRSATKLGLMPGDAFFAATDLPRIPVSERTVKGKIIPQAEVRKIFDSIQTDSPRGARDTALLSVLWDTGMRRAELVRLEMADDQGATLRVGDQQIPLSSETRTALSRWKEQRGPLPGPIFVPINYGRVLTHPLTEPGVLKILHELAERAGVLAFGTQDLRRTKLEGEELRASG